MLTFVPKPRVLVAVALFAVGGLVGCAPPKELVTANNAVEAARSAGKDKECPKEFSAAENLKNEAYRICKPCDTAKAIELANQATAQVDRAVPGQAGAAARAGAGARSEAGCARGHRLDLGQPELGAEGPVLDADLVVVQRHERHARPGHRIA